MAAAGDGNGVHAAGAARRRETERSGDADEQSQATKQRNFGACRGDNVEGCSMRL